MLPLFPLPSFRGILFLSFSLSFLSVFSKRFRKNLEYARRQLVNTMMTRACSEESSYFSSCVYTASTKPNILLALPYCQLLCSDSITNRAKVPPSQSRLAWARRTFPTSVCFALLFPCVYCSRRGFQCFFVIKKTRAVMTRRKSGWKESPFPMEWKCLLLIE